MERGEQLAHLGALQRMQRDAHESATRRGARARRDEGHGDARRVEALEPRDGLGRARDSLFVGVEEQNDGRSARLARELVAQVGDLSARGACDAARAHDLVDEAATTGARGPGDHHADGASRERVFEGGEGGVARAVTTHEGRTTGGVLGVEGGRVRGDGARVAAPSGEPRAR